ncbi:MAG TPA: hypothetical protein DCL77_15600 [Prolixibacteraceae bacterium]|nr:hypothetical protein [Prolixibacteraceae bacterium]
MENNEEVQPAQRTIKENFKAWFSWKIFLGILIGGLAGYLYYHFVGCASGTCPITSSPYVSTLWGSMMGLLFVTSPCRNGRC